MTQPTTREESSASTAPVAPITYAEHEAILIAHGYEPDMAEFIAYMVPLADDPTGGAKARLDREAEIDGHYRDFGRAMGRAGVSHRDIDVGMIPAEFVSGLLVTTTPRQRSAMRNALPGGLLEVPLDTRTVFLIREGYGTRRRRR